MAALAVKQYDSDMFWRRPPIWLLRALFPKVIWRGHSGADDKVYLTFDDGPSELTIELSDILESYNQRASFFLLGKQVEKHPELLRLLQSKGHTIGHHGYAHIDAWKHPASAYLADVKKGLETFESELFRPAYGRLKYKHYKEISKTHKIVLWDLMPGDFMKEISANEITSFVLKHIRPGSIIVLHDQVELRAKLLTCLPQILEGLKQKGLHSEALR